MTNDYYETVHDFLERRTIILVMRLREFDTSEKYTDDKNNIFVFHALWWVRVGTTVDCSTYGYTTYTRNINDVDTRYRCIRTTKCVTIKTDVNFMRYLYVDEGTFEYLNLPRERYEAPWIKSRSKRKQIHHTAPRNDGLSFNHSLITGALLFINYSDYEIITPIVTVRTWS